MGVSVLSRQVRRSFRVISALVVGALLFGCADEPEVLTGVDVVEVSGEFGASPELTYSTPLDVPESESQVVWAGDGPTVAVGDTVLLDIYAQNALDGSQIKSTFFDLPEIFEVTPEALGENLYEAVLGQQAGARLLLLDDGGEDFPIVLVLDVLAGRAAGEPREAEEGFPTVKLADTGEPRVKIPKALRKTSPDELMVRALVRGSGRQVKEGQTVIVQYKAVSWSDGKVIDSTWEELRTPFTTIVGDSGPIPAWDEALIEQSVGSQILMVAPPELAYEGSSQAWADDAIVFVIDILYAGTLAAPESADTSDNDADVDQDEPDFDNSTDE